MEKIFSSYLSSVLWLLDSEQKLFLPLSIPEKSKGLSYYENDTNVPNINIWKDSEALLWRKNVFFDTKLIFSYHSASIVLCKCHSLCCVLKNSKFIISSHAALSLTWKHYLVNDSFSLNTIFSNGRIKMEFPWSSQCSGHTLIREIWTCLNHYFVILDFYDWQYTQNN